MKLACFFLLAAAPLAAVADAERPAVTRPVCDAFGSDRQWCMAELRRQSNVEPEPSAPRAGARVSCDDALDPDVCRRKPAFVKPALGPARLLR